MTAFDPFHVIEEVVGGLREGLHPRQMVAARGSWFVRLLEAVERTGAVAVAALHADGGYKVFDVDESSLWKATEGAENIWLLSSKNPQK